ncbi:MAG: hypothetical protein ACTSXH_10755 [Promethearchaeota archaeon]
MFWIPNITTIVLAWLIQCFILSGFILSRYLEWNTQNANHWLIKGIRGSFYLTFTSFSLVLLDTNVKLMIFLIKYDTPLAPHLSSIILTSFLAIELLTLILFLIPNLKKVIIFGVMLIVFLITFEFYLNVIDLTQVNVFSSNYSPMLFAIGVPIIFGFITYLFLTSINLFFKNSQKLTAILNEPFWNKIEKMNRIWELKVQFIIWFLLSLEVILNLEGLSLLSWTGVISWQKMGQTWTF